MICIEELQPQTHPEWDAYVDSQQGANCYHLRVWQEVATRAYRLRAPFLLARRGGAVCGVLPLFLVKQPLGGYLTTGMFGAYGPILADSDDVRRQLIDAAQAIAVREKVRYFSIKSLIAEPIVEGLYRRDMSVVARIDLMPGVDGLWTDFKKEIRKAVRKAEKSDLEVRTGLAELPAFYAVLAENMHHKGTPIYGYSFMQELAASLGEQCGVITLWRHGQPVSGALVIYYKDTVYLPFSSSIPSSFEFRPNNLLFWEIIKQGCARGMKLLDLGRSTKDSSSLLFKLRWGAEVLPQPWYIATLRGHPPTLDSKTPSTQRLVQLWRRLPRPLANTVGPEICRRWLV